MRIMVALALAFPLTGCVTVGSDVVPVGKDTYEMSRTGVGPATHANTDTQALKAANEYCPKLGKHMLPKSSAEPAAYAWSPRHDNLVFMCVDAKDLVHLHPATAPTS